VHINNLKPLKKGEDNNFTKILINFGKFNIENKIPYCPTNALNFINCRFIKNTLKI